MMSVEVKVNGKLIARGTARRLDPRSWGTRPYELHTGRTIRHRYEAGAIALAKKILFHMKVEETHDDDA